MPGLIWQIECTYDGLLGFMRNPDECPGNRQEAIVRHRYGLVGLLNLEDILRNTKVALQ